MRQTMRPVIDGEGDTLYVHLTCGATMWRGHADAPTTALACDVCTPQAAQGGDGAWRMVFATQPDQPTAPKP
jgi:hypothetical protein